MKTISISSNSRRMLRRSLSCLTALAALLVTATAQGGIEPQPFRAKTDAGIVISPAGAPLVQLNFTAELTKVPEFTKANVEFGWGTVGGIQPEPFRVFIPAGCFVATRRGFHVDDFRACGVQIAFVSDARSPGFLTITDFDARIVPSADGPYRVDIVARFIGAGREHSILGALGGAPVRIAIGGESAISPPLRVVTVSGVDPQPF